MVMGGGGGRPTYFNDLPPPLLCKLNVMNESSLCWKLCCIILLLRFNHTLAIPITTPHNVHFYIASYGPVKGKEASFISDIHKQ